MGLPGPPAVDAMFVTIVLEARTYDVHLRVSAARKKVLSKRLQEVS